MGSPRPLPTAAHCIEPPSKGICDVDGENDPRLDFRNTNTLLVKNTRPDAGSIGRAGRSGARLIRTRGAEAPTPLAQPRGWEDFGYSKQNCAGRKPEQRMNKFRIGDGNRSAQPFNRFGNRTNRRKVMFNTAHPSTNDPRNRSRRRAIRASELIVCVVALALPASTHTFASAAEIPARSAQEQHACAEVMGLHQPGDLYDTCIRSLEKTLSGLDQVRATSAACTQRGLTPGTHAFAICAATEQ